MKDSQVLRVARAKLRSEQVDFICVAIGEVRAVPSEQRERLKSWVNSLLCFNGIQYETYCNWLRTNYPEYRNLTYKAARKGRLAWMDWMITTLESEGK